MLDVQLRDGTGTKNRAHVTEDNALKVTNVPIGVNDISPEELTRRQYFTDFFRDSAESSDANVDGSVDAQEFEAQAPAGFVIFITQIRLVFHDTNMNMGGGNAGRFASVAAAPGLPNGLRLIIDQGGIQTDFFLNPVQNMGDFFQYNEDFTNITGAFGGGIDYLSFDFIFPQAVPLTISLTDRVYLKIEDDLTNLNFFHIIVSGIKESLA